MSSWSTRARGQQVTMMCRLSDRRELLPRQGPLAGAAADRTCWRSAADTLEGEHVRGGIQLKIEATFEVTNPERPAVFAGCIARFDT